MAIVFKSASVMPHGREVRVCFEVQSNAHLASTSPPVTRISLDALSP